MKYAYWKGYQTSVSGEPMLDDNIPFKGTHDLPLPISPEIPFKADLATVDRVKSMGGWSWVY